MGLQNYSVWLANELAASRFALLAVLEERDRLLYVEAPALRNDYMSKIGTFEETILEAELDVTQLERKRELIQAAINRREAIDLVAIGEKLEQERAEKIAEVEAADKTANEMPVLTAEEQSKMQEMYRQIIRDFHPQLNIDVSETQKDLYEKALDAYKRQNFDAVSLIHDMFYDALKTEGAVEYVVQETTIAKTKDQIAEEQKRGVEDISAALATDYSLASKLFACFSALESDVVLQSATARYTEERQKVLAEIDQIREGFPFNAKAVLQDPAKVNEYLESLQSRYRRCEEAQEEIERKIGKLLGGGSND